MARGFNSNNMGATFWNGATSTTATISFWFNVTTAPASYYGLIGTGVGVDIYIKASGQLALYGLPGFAATDPMSGFTGSTNTWYHVAYSFLNPGSAIVYVNGSAISTVTGIATNMAALGSMSYGTDGTAGRYLIGAMADVAFWNVQLTALEIAALALGARPNTIRPNALKEYHPLDGLQSPEPDLNTTFTGPNNGSVGATTLAFGPPFTQFTPRWPQYNFVPVTFTLMSQACL